MFFCNAVFFFFCFVCDGQLRVVDFIRTLGPHPFDMNVLLVQQRLGATLEPLFMTKSRFSDCQNRRQGFQIRHCPWTGPGSAVVEKGDLFYLFRPSTLHPLPLQLWHLSIHPAVTGALPGTVEPGSTFLVTTLCVLVNLLLPITCLGDLAPLTTTQLIRDSAERSVLHDNSVFWLHPLSCVCVVHGIDYSNTAQRSEVTQTCRLCVRASPLLQKQMNRRTFPLCLNITVPLLESFSSLSSNPVSSNPLTV